MSYCGCLKTLKLNSTQRRHDHYRILYCYKVLKGLVPNPGLSIDYWDSRRGPIIKGPRNLNVDTAASKTLQSNSFMMARPKLFNSLPDALRHRVNYDLDEFKPILNSYLSSIPDNLCTPNVSNSLIDHISRRTDKSSWSPPKELLRKDDKMFTCLPTLLSL